MRAAEDASQCVIVALRDRIELVIVAASATDCHPQQRLAERVDLFVDDVEFQRLLVLLFVVCWAECQKCRRDEVFLLLLRRIERQQVTGELFQYEAIERFVAVERTDCVIAIPPGFGKNHRPAAAAGFRKAGDVQPVPTPTLAEVRRRQQTIDDLLTSVRRCIRNEVVNLRRSRWQTDQVERNSTQPRCSIGVADGRKAGRFLLGEDEAVEIGGWP